MATARKTGSKAPAKKTAAKKPADRKPVAKKASAKKPASRKAAPKKAPARKGAAKKSSPRSSATKSTAKSTARKSPAATSRGRKYDLSVGRRVGRELHEMHRGQLTIGRSNKKVTNPKQAIAIALAEKRREGAKVPPNPNQKKR